MQNMIKQNLFIGGMLLLLTISAMAAPVFTPNSQPTGYLSRPVVTFFDVSSGTESFYQVDFRKGTWAGNVLANHIDKFANVQTTGPWDGADPTLTTAASLLNIADYNTVRKIATFGHPFRWASLTAAEQTAIGSVEIMNFVRGDRSNEEPNGLAFYQRESVLGDILHSNIYFWDHGTTQSLYVGSNDGMLHSFDANTGVENFAYIPSMVIPNLSKLAEKTYVHTHFVDGPIIIANVDVSGTQKTILVGALGAGGAGLYALDITSPAVAGEVDVANKVLWEITATGSYSNLGHTFGAPLITKLIDGTPAVIIGNGYVNAGNGHAVLYIIDAMTGALISAIDTGSGSAASPNGLSSPTLYDKDGDGKPDYAYAGDIDGNLWKFDLSNNTSSLLFTTSPAQAISSAPVVRPHTSGGQMIDFVTGRILTSGDKIDESIHYAYGIWDGAPAANDQLLTQILTESAYTFASVPGSNRVRTVTGNLPDWSAGSGHHKGWKVALPAGERVVGERPFYNNGRFYFLSTNPTIGLGENWLNELVFATGGSPLLPIFDLSNDGLLTAPDDLAANGSIPVAKYLGIGVFSQPLLVNGFGLSTTLYAFHTDLPISGIPTDPESPFLTGGEFDFDIFYYGDPVTTTESIPNTGVGDSATGLICKKTRDIDKELDSVSKKCTEVAGMPAGNTYLTDYTTGAICKDNSNPDKVEYWQTLTCNTVTEIQVTSEDYKKFKHVHEYNGKYGVTGVNMLNASLIDFNLINAIVDPTTPFKILVMNQYLNPAVMLSVGGAAYESVETYANLASQTDPDLLLSSLVEYDQGNIGTLIFNLPLDVFKSKDWWNDGGAIRAGLIPTQTGCVNNIDSAGIQDTPGLYGERFNGSFAIQIIKPDTPGSALELNGPDVSYGWRVNQAEFTNYVLAEYLAFWHHPNKACYGDIDWVPDPPEDVDSKPKGDTPAPGSADPVGGVFGTVITSVVTVTDIDGAVTTTTTYSDATEYIKIVTDHDDGSTTIYQKFRDGTEETVTVWSGEPSDVSGSVDPNTGSPNEELVIKADGRQTWRDLLD